MSAPGAVRARAAAAAWAVLCGARSVREVQRACGWASENSADMALRLARDEGLVDWEPGRSGTLRPRVKVIGILT